MKRIILLLVIASMAEISYSQDGAVVVSAIQQQNLFQQKNTAVLHTELLKTYELMQTLEKAKEKIDWIKTMNSVKRTLEILNDLYCNAHWLTAYLDISNTYSTCWGKIELNLTLTKYQAALDILNTVLSTGYSMTQGERLKSWNDALDKLEDSQKGMYNITAKLRASTTKKINQYYNAQSRAELMNIRR